jgi:hypothetical protein
MELIGLALVVLVAVAALVYHRGGASGPLP